MVLRCANLFCNAQFKYLHELPLRFGGHDRLSGRSADGRPSLPMAKKSNYQNRCDQKRNRQPQLRHRLMIPHHQLPWRLPPRGSTG